MIWHCLFEQSGTFRDVFRSFGFDSFDYDLCDDYGKTDYKIDLFNEIARAYFGLSSIFDTFHEGDGIFAFFPCTAFTTKYALHISCKAKQYKDYSDLDKLKVSLDCHSQLSRNYTILCELVYVCLSRGFKLVVENPYNFDGKHYLTQYFPFPPVIIDWDRKSKGDYYNKPTQFFFFGFEPTNNVDFDEPIAYYDIKYKEVSGFKRSLISPEYARRFVKSFIIKEVH